MAYYIYPNTSADVSVEFTDGMSTLELAALQAACPNKTLTPELRLAMKQLTGCATFLEFKVRILSPHTHIDQDQSLVLFDNVELTRKTRKVSFKAVMLNSRQDVLAITQGRLEHAVSAREESLSYHNLLFVTPVKDIRNQGLASVITQSQEDAAFAAGSAYSLLTAAEVDRETLYFGPYSVTVYPSGRTGRTIWGRHGYDFDPERMVAQRDSIWTAFRALVTAARDDGTLARDIADAVLAEPRPIRTWEMQDVVTDDNRFLGDQALEGKDWAGRKDLRPNSEGYHRGLEQRIRFLNEHPQRGVPGQD